MINSWKKSMETDKNRSDFIEADGHTLTPKGFNVMINNWKKSMEKVLAWEDKVKNADEAIPCKEEIINDESKYCQDVSTENETNLKEEVPHCSSDMPDVVNNAIAEPKKQNNKELRVSLPKKTDNLKFPCPLKNHKHEIGKCSEFFFLDPSTRGKNCRWMVCQCCLGPFNTCKPKCIHVKVVESAELICIECRKWAIDNNITSHPRNILFCHNTSHTKLNNEDLVESLNTYLEGFDPEILNDKNIKL